MRTNVICVNLSGVVTFLIQRIQPSPWWEADRARKATRYAAGLWILPLSALVVVILVSKRAAWSGSSQPSATRAAETTGIPPSR